MILYTADWHLKLGQKNVPVKWALNRYQMFFEEIYKLEKQCNMHIIGGDLFDRLPNMEELELYFSFIRKVGIPTIIYDGNHEATKKNKTFFTQLKQVSRDINPLINIVDISYIDADLGYGILPYADLHRKGSIDHFDSRMPLFTHVRGEIPPHVKPEIDLDLLADFPVVFAGDLHAHSNTQRNIVYPGSPMTTSFHRAKVKTGYLLINEQDWSWMWEELTLPQLIRKTVSDPSDMIATDFDHTIYEIQGDIQDLAGIKNTELLDKKVVIRKSEAALIIDKDMTIEEELVEYLSYILEISQDKIPDILGTYNDYVTNSEMG
jgi:DNA repair exonuclease SbcCD nuclease subunit|tara:strand:+ start:12450 stop:13409 length:960 start_codon:yes stop_codon:yes gene_type:complete